MADDKTTELRNELYRSFVVLFNNQPLMLEIWRNRVGEPLKEVTGRLTLFHLNQLMAADQSAYETYSPELVEDIKGAIANLLGIGFFVYYLDKKEIEGEPIKRVDDVSVKDHLMKVVKTLEDSVTEPNDEANNYDPPKYAFETCKEVFWYWLKTISERPDDNNFIKQLTSDIHREFFITKAPWLVCEGYIVGSEQYSTKKATGKL
jgi:hypothetical protein